MQTQRDTYIEMEKYIKEKSVDNTVRETVIETWMERCRHGNGHVWRELKDDTSM